MRWTTPTVPQPVSNHLYRVCDTVHYRVACAGRWSLCCLWTCWLHFQLAQPSLKSSPRSWRSLSQQKARQRMRSCKNFTFLCTVENWKSSCFAHKVKTRRGSTHRELNSKSNSLHLSKDFLLFTGNCLQEALFLDFLTSKELLKQHTIHTPLATQHMSLSVN